MLRGQSQTGCEKASSQAESPDKIPSVAKAQVPFGARDVWAKARTFQRIEFFGRVPRGFCAFPRSSHLFRNL
jgi:hypothetical protein